MCGQTTIYTNSILTYSCSYINRKPSLLDRIASIGGYSRKNTFILRINFKQYQFFDTCYVMESADLDTQLMQLEHCGGE